MLKYMDTDPVHMSQEFGICISLERGCGFSPDSSLCPLTTPATFTMIPTLARLVTSYRAGGLSVRLLQR